MMFRTIIRNARTASSVLQIFTQGISSNLKVSQIISSLLIGMDFEPPYNTKQH